MCQVQVAFQTSLWKHVNEGTAINGPPGESVKTWVDVILLYMEVTVQSGNDMELSVSIQPKCNCADEITGLCDNIVPPTISQRALNRAFSVLLNPTRHIQV